MPLYSVITIMDAAQNRRVVAEVRRVREQDAFHRNVILVEAGDEMDAFTKVASLDNVTVERVVEGVGEWN
jgi:hypothetical protein